MRIVHTADIHIGAGKNQFPDLYLERQIKSLYEIKRVCEEKKADYLIVAGDFFDKSIPNLDEVNAASKWLVEINSLKCKIIFISGNHEVKEVGKTSLDTFSIFKPKLENVKVYTKPALHVHGKIAFCCIPYGFDIEKYVKHFREKLTDQELYVIGHLALQGTETDSGYKIEGSHNLLNLNVKAFFLGDIHKRFISDCNRIHMVGAPIQHYWADKLPRGISFIDTSKSLCPEFIELNVPKLEVTKDLEKAKQSQNIVKFVGTATEEEIENTNIVETTPYFEEKEIVDYKSDFNITDGLPEFLAEHELTKQEQLSAIKLVEKIVEKL